MIKSAKHQNSETFIVKENRRLSPLYSLLIVSPRSSIKLSEYDFKPGQFVQVLPPANSTFLRRPISICNVDFISNTLWLLVRDAGKGTHALVNVTIEDNLEIIYPLGNGFTTSLPPNSSPLLIGGGVGVAPLLNLGKTLTEKGLSPRFLLGARSEKDLLLLDEFKAVGEVFCSTDDGSAGHPGVVTLNPVLQTTVDMIYTCGPKPVSYKQLRAHKK